MKLTETQQKALDIVQWLIKEEKITLQQAFDLITAIYENDKEYVYIPYPSPYTEPSKPWTTEPWTWPQPWYYQLSTTTCQQESKNNANSTGCECKTWNPLDCLHGYWNKTIAY